MCVISIIENDNQIPSKKSSELMWNTNPHGAGFGKFDKKEKCIYIKKGIDLKEINRLTQIGKKEGNMSMIQHYRIASVGSHDNKDLTHGFEIKNGSSNDLEYYTNNDVLWHNGTIDMDTLNDIAKDIMIKNSDAIYPDNELSDSRLLAFILNYVDYSILNMFIEGNKFVIMNGKSGKITKYGHWDKVKDGKQNLITSNNYFKQDLFKTSQSFDYMVNNDADYLTKDEKKEVKRIYKKYSDLFDSENDIIEQYLSYGMSVFDIEDSLESELNYGAEY